MANMDYPGPCPSCSAIDSCSTGSQKDLAVKGYCKGLEMEVNSWKARLYDVLADDKAEAAGESLALLKSTIRELEAAVEKLQTECPASLGEEEQAIGSRLETLRVHYTRALEAISPGWFGG